LGKIFDNVEKMNKCKTIISKGFGVEQHVSQGGVEVVLFMRELT